MLKQLFLLSVLFCVLHKAFSQQAAMSVDINNVVYEGVENPLSIVVENIPCSAISVKSTNGNIEGKGCKFILKDLKIHSYNENTVDVIVYKKTKIKLKEVARWTFSIKRFPNPVVKIGPSAGGDIERAVFVAQTSLRAEFEDFGPSMTFEIKSYWVHIDYAGTYLMDKNIYNTGNSISSEIYEAFSFLQDGDIVRFHNVVAIGPHKIEKTLYPPAFIMRCGDGKSPCNARKMFRIPYNEFNYNLKPKMLTAIEYKEYFEGAENINSSNTEEAIICDNGIYVKISDRYVIHIPSEIPIRIKDQGHLFVIDSANADKTLTLLIYDTGKVFLSSNCRNIGDFSLYPPPVPIKYLKPVSGKFIVSSPDSGGWQKKPSFPLQKISILLKDLVFRDPVTGERYQFNNVFRKDVGRL